MQHREEPASIRTEREVTLPIDFGEASAIVAREVHVEDGTIVSDEAGVERQLAQEQPHGRSGIEEAYAEVRDSFEQEFNATRTATVQRARERTFAQAEPNYRAGFIAGRDLRYADQEFEAIEAELRREYESSTAALAAPGAPPQDNSWERQRTEIKRGFQKARASN